jgi:hypothetical protein
MTTHQAKTLDFIRSMAGTYVGFKADPTIRALITKGLITFSPTAFGAGYCKVRIV